MRHRSRFVASLGFALGAIVFVAPAWSQCPPSVPIDDLEYRFGLADTVKDDEDLLTLLDTPTVITVEAVPAPPGDPATTVATTETHVLYAIEAAAMTDVLRDAATLSEIIPDLAIHRTLCGSGSDMVKQMQRTEFNVLFFKFGTEYLIDVRYAMNGPEEYGSYWGMYESLDGKLAYQYGSWYFRNVIIEDRNYTYVRHFIINGVKSRIPGLRLIVQRSAGNRISAMLDAIYREAVSRHGNSPVASR